MKTDRLQYIDLAKTIAVISVLFYHFPLQPKILGLGGWLNTYFLSLFFCISGLLLHPTTDFNWLYLKVKRLIIPLVSFSILYIPFVAFMKNADILDIFNHIIHDDAKGGYWFIYTLMSGICVIWVINYICQRFSFAQWIYWGLLICPWFLTFIGSHYMSQDLLYLFSIASFRRYYIFIVLGIILQHIHINKFKNLVSVSISICYILISVIFIVCCQNMTNYIDFPVWLFANVFGCLFWINTCIYICERHTFSKLIEWISTDSIGIYLVQFFFLSATKDFACQLTISPYYIIIPYTLLLFGLSFGTTRLLYLSSLTKKMFLGI